MMPCAAITGRNSPLGYANCSRRRTFRRAGAASTQRGAEAAHRDGRFHPAAHSAARTPYVAASPHLATSPLHRGHRAAIPRREALILQAALNHPWLLHDHLEELAEAEFRHADSQKLKSALIDVFAHRLAENSARVRPRRRSGPGGTRRRARPPRFCRCADPHRAHHHHAHRSGARGRQAAADDVLLTWKQLVALHRQWHSLIRELKDAELALGQDNTEANYARLVRREGEAVHARWNRSPDRGLRRLFGPSPANAVSVLAKKRLTPPPPPFPPRLRGREGRGLTARNRRFAFAVDRVSRSLTEFRENLRPRFGRWRDGACPFERRPRPQAGLSFRPAPALRPPRRGDSP